MKLKHIIDNSDIEQVFQILLNKLNQYSKKSTYYIEQVRSFYGAELVAILIASSRKLDATVIVVSGEPETIAFLRDDLANDTIPLCDLQNLSGLESLEVETELDNENALAIILHDLSILKEI